MIQHTDLLILDNREACTGFCDILVPKKRGTLNPSKTLAVLIGRH